VTHTVDGITVQTAFSPTGYNNNYPSTKPSGPDTMKLLRIAIFSTNASLGFAIFSLPLVQGRRCAPLGRSGLLQRHLLQRQSQGLQVG
jgi:hypothetical protein